MFSLFNPECVCLFCFIVYVYVCILSGLGFNCPSGGSMQFTSIDKNLQFSLKVQQTERKQNNSSTFFFFNSCQFIIHIIPELASSGWLQAKVATVLCQDWYFQSNLNLKTQLMMTQHFEKLLFPPGLKSYLLMFGEFHLAIVSAEFPEINYTVRALPFYHLYLCGVLLK